jgi:hypothetical protein
MPLSSSGTLRRSKVAPRLASLVISGKAFERPPAPTSWIEMIGLALAQLPAGVDDFLGPAFHLRIAALDRVEVQVGRVGAGRHRRCGRAGHADAHAGTAQLDQQAADRDVVLVGVLARDVADAAGDHDRLVVAVHGVRADAAVAPTFCS